MTNIKYRCVFFIISISFFVLSTFAYGDIYWESEQIVKGIPGQPDKKKTIRHYFTPQCSRMDIGENVMIADFKTMTGYVLNTNDKMYLEMRMNNVGKIPKGLKEDIIVVPTNETKKIAGYKCQKYYVTFMKRKYVQWLSKEVKGYKELKAINDKLSGVVQQNPLFQMGIVGKMHKLDGFPVQMVMPMTGGMTKIITLKRVEKKTLDQKVFRVPKGYNQPN